MSVLAEPLVGSHTRQARQTLIGLTVRKAIEQSAYYRQALGDREIDSIDELRSLPFLTKQDLVERLDDLRTFDRFPDALMYTSGTTGRPLEVPVYREEIEANERLIIEPLQARLAEPLPLTVTVLRVGHGSHVLTPAVPSLPCHISYGVDQLVDMLGREHWVRAATYERPQVLEANVLNLRHITAELLDRGIAPSDFGLAALSLSGWYLPRAEREALEELWQAAVLDRYGVTEVNGDGKWCPTCQAYHFDFTTIPEVLSLETDEPVTEGIGRLVLTGLYPFNQAVPKIRYEIGDLVRVRPADCRSAEPAISFLGRLRDVLLGPDGDLVLAPADVAEALAPHPDIARKSHTGFLQFAIGWRDSTPQVRIELTYQPRRYPRRTADLRSAVEHTLHARQPRMEEVDIEFHGPGGLGRTTKV